MTKKDKITIDKEFLDMVLKKVEELNDKIKQLEKIDDKIEKLELDLENFRTQKIENRNIGQDEIFHSVELFPTDKVKEINVLEFRKKLRELMKQYHILQVVASFFKKT